MSKNKLTTLWVRSQSVNHMFASNREGIISLCGDRRHPKTAKEDTQAPYCFTCVKQLRIILNYERASG